MPRIALLSPAFPEMTDTSTAQYTQHLAAALYSQGHEVDVITAAHTRVLPTFKKIQIHKIIKNWNLLDLGHLIPTLNRLKPEILHIIDPPTRVLIPALLELNKALWKLPIITTLLRLEDKGLFNQAQLYSITLNSNVVTVTQDTYREELEKFFIGRSSNMTVVPWGGEKDNVFNTDLHVRENWDLKPTDKVIGLWGEMAHNNGFYEFFNAVILLMKSDPAVKVFFIPKKIPSAFERANFLDYLEKQKCLTQVVFSGHLSYEEYAKAKHVADFFVFLSPKPIEKFFPEELCQALHCQTPCLTWAQNRFYSEFGLAHGKNVWLGSYKNIKSLRADLELLLASANLRETLRNNSEAFTKVFGFDGISNEISRLYSTLV